MRTSFIPALLFLLTIVSVSYAQSVKPVQIDEFGSPSCEEYLAHMDNAITQAANNPSSIILVHVYEGKTTRYKHTGDKYTKETPRPQYGLANAVIRSMKKYLKLHKAPTERFLFKSVGFREEFKVDIWLLPKGAKEPEPSPTLTKLRYRKGKPSGFCLWSGV